MRRSDTKDKVSQNSQRTWEKLKEECNFQSSTDRSSQRMIVIAIKSLSFQNKNNGWQVGLF